MPLSILWARKESFISPKKGEGSQDAWRIWDGTCTGDIAVYFNRIAIFVTEWRQGHYFCICWITDHTDTCKSILKILIVVKKSSTGIKLMKPSLTITEQSQIVQSTSCSKNLRIPHVELCLCGWYTNFATPIVFREKETKNKAPSRWMS